MLMSFCLHSVALQVEIQTITGHYSLGSRLLAQCLSASVTTDIVFSKSNDNGKVHSQMTSP